MKTVNLVQGTPEWHAHRAQHFNASDAPAMLGVSPYKTRAQLVREFATGVTQEVDAATQRRFDDGHRYEALARPMAEQIVGEELFPCVGVSDCGRYSASFDGLTLMEDTAFEHKSLNDELRHAMREAEEFGADLPEHYCVQMEQQCMVSGAERVLFVASKWDGEALVDHRTAWYVPDADRRARIIAGWEQFAADVAAYVPESAPAPVATGRAPETLPSLRVEVTGMVTASNLAEFKASALAVLGGINRDLQTDDDFANAEQTVKWCKDVEDRLAATKEAVLAQTTDIEAVFRTMDEVSAETRRIRLELDKLVKAEKENRKVEIVTRARRAYEQHEAELKAETKGVWIVLPAPDFGGVIKGKRTLSSMQDAVDTVLANAKIAANESAKHIRAALACLSEETAEHKHLFPDYLSFISKPVEDIRALVRGRIAEHQQREAERLDRERERIRQEELDRIEREKRAAADEAAQTEAMQPKTFVELPPQVRRDPLPTAPAAPRAASVTIKLGDINARIAPLSITAEGLASLGFEAVGQQRAAKLYAERDFPLICTALVDLLTRTATQKDAA